MKRSALKADPAKTRAFVQRGRGRLARSPLKHKCTNCAARFERAHVTCPICLRPMPRQAPPSTSGLRPWQTTATIKVPPGARKEALARSKGLCVACVHEGGIARRAVQVHHVYPKRLWPELAKLAACLVGVCVEHHANHESAHRRLPLAVLPPETIALAADDGPMQNYLARTYPA